MEGGRLPLIIVSSSENLNALSFLCLLWSQNGPNQNLTNAIDLQYHKTADLDLLGFEKKSMLTAERILQGGTNKVTCAVLQLLLLLLHKPWQHPSPLPENVTYSMKRVKGNKASAVSTTSAFTSIQSAFHVQNKTVQRHCGAGRHSAA